MAVVVRKLYRDLMRYARRPDIYPPELVEPVFTAQSIPMNTVLRKSTLRDIIRTAFRTSDPSSSSEAMSQAFEAVRLTSERASALSPNISEKLPAFVYNKAELPGATVMLHFFEPRYRAMIKKAMDHNQRFLYVYRPNRERIETEADEEGLVGLLGVVLKVDQCVFDQDGRANVKATAGPRVRITEAEDKKVYEGSPLYNLKYERAPDDAVDSEDEQKVQKVAVDCEAMVHEIYKYWPRFRLEMTLGIPPDASEHPEDFSFWLSKWVQDFNAQALSFETTSTLQRFAFLTPLLNRMRDTLKERFSHEEAEEEEKP